MDLMLGLNGHLRILFENNWRCTKKWQRGYTFYLMTFTLKYGHVNAFEGAPNGSSEDTPTFDFEIKCTWVYDQDALEDEHGGALVSAKKFTKQFNNR